MWLGQRSPGHSSPRESPVQNWKVNLSSCKDDGFTRLLKKLNDSAWHQSTLQSNALPITCCIASDSLFTGRNSQCGDPPGGSNGNDGAQRCDIDHGGSRIINELASISAAPSPITLTLSSFAVTRKAYRKIVRTFSHDYEKTTGQPVRFRLTFGGSGTQARAIIDGLPADIASLALPLDLLKIQEAGLVHPGWENRFPNRSVVCESVVSIVTRQGNPKGIEGWEDLAREDVKIIVANPRTAGVARWIFLALWGHKLRHGEVAARRYVTKVFDNVEIMPRDAREASDVFYTQKFGDVLLTYENEAVFTNLVVSPKSPLPFISPNNNVRIVCPGSLIDRNLEGKPPEVIEAAKSFMNYLFTPDAQKEFLECGFRSSIATLENIEKIDNLPVVKKVWDVEKRLGSWSVVQKKFFDEEGILNGILSDVSARKLNSRLAASKRV